MLISLPVILVLGLIGTANGQSPANFKLVTTFTRPGHGGTDPSFLTGVFRFQFDGTGLLAALPSIPPFQRP